MIKKKLAIIGTGNISKFHCHAFKEAGFDLTFAAGSKNSKRALEFGEIHSVKEVFSEPEEILNVYSQWDALILAIPTENNEDYLEKILSINKPTLIEKPVSTNPDTLSSFKINSFPNIRVAYNRRFYATIQRAKQFIEEEEFVHARMELPEKVISKGDYSNVLLNSCHGIDLLYFLFGELELLDVRSFKKDLGRLVTLQSSRKDLINLTMNWNSPSNFIIILEGDKRKLEIRPFEDSHVFQGMEILEPTEELPLRRFVPKAIESVSSFPGKKNPIKPGFLEQALEIRRLVENKNPTFSASLYEAYKVQKLLKEIL